MADEDDDYELLPHKQITDLKKELEQLKKGPSPESGNQMDKLNDSINNLLGLFKEAASQMHLEEQEGGMVAEKLIPIEEKLDQVLEQNQKIAEGIVALADLVKDLQEQKKKESGQDYGMRMAPPSFGMPPPLNMPPPMNMPPPRQPMQGNLPPFPPQRRR